MARQAMSDLIGQRQLRIDKIAQLKKLGIDPFPSKSYRTNLADEISNNYSAFENQEATVAGRLMTLRRHGAISFGNIQDSSGSIQLYIKEDSLNKTSTQKGHLGYDLLDMLDLGDIVEAKGKVVKTKTGEISIEAETMRLLTKAIRPLPEKWAGLKDKETIFRKRYLDLIMDPSKKVNFQKSAELLFAIREFMNSKGFLEIKTPILQPVYGGTSAKPFSTHVNSLDKDFYLAVSHELYLKRLITAGFDNVYNIAGYFRNEGIDRTHNPEFTMLETMTAFQNYEYNMDLIEEMYLYLGKKVFGRTVFKICGQDIDFSKPWERIRMIDAVKKYSNYDFNSIKSLEDAHKALDEIGYKEDKPSTIAECMVKVFEEKVEEQLIQPTFVYGHPIEVSPLAKSMSDDSRFAERFEIFIGGIEGGDNWTELNDPLELYERLREQVEKGRGGEDSFHPMDIEFLECMEYGMPPTTGLGPGIERLAMMYTETEYIDDVIFFPLLKPSPVTSIQKELYGEEYLVEPSEIHKNTVNKQDFNKRFAIILNKELAGWELTNTVGHISAYLGSKVGNTLQSKPEFETADGEMIPSNSQYPVVTFGANSTQFTNLLRKIIEAGTIYIAFTKDMIEFTDDKKLANAIKKQTINELQILGIGIFGDNTTLKGLTNKFSLWK